MIVYGTRMYGRVDEMPEGYVATQFVHIWFIPLVPISSMLVTDDSNDRSVRGVKLGWSGKSILAAYLRAGGVLATIACLGFAIITALSMLDGGLEHLFQRWDYYSQSWVIDWTTLIALPFSFGAAIFSALVVWGSYKLLGPCSDARRRMLLEAATHRR
ncbi:hypothetical protein [Sandaracinus amylolyticus]|uniref:Uncharacterized protein n=1 Tax=Sandaracinus amylolyticus TaxID=927083 RepID=A0A0F6YL56_9BACT|nr:hypothetical protein [Sandaracinus amylolyticus]AKF09476.1 hypothetical protein DB32_006625 [Sandaracinus amylolyticus]